MNHHRFCFGKNLPDFLRPTSKVSFQFCLRIDRSLGGGDNLDSNIGDPGYWDFLHVNGCGSREEQDEYVGPHTGVCLQCKLNIARG